MMAEDSEWTPPEPLEVRLRRREQMIADRDSGMTLSMLSARYGLSRERCRQVMAKEPVALGLSRREQLERRRAYLLRRRERWAVRSSPAALQNVLRLDAELADIADELADDDAQRPLVNLVHTP
jgi:hypothetical protein